MREHPKLFLFWHQVHFKVKTCSDGIFAKSKASKSLCGCVVALQISNLTMDYARQGQARAASGIPHDPIFGICHTLVKPPIQRKFASNSHVQTMLTKFAKQTHPKTTVYPVVCGCAYVVCVWVRASISSSSSKNGSRHWWVSSMETR